MKPKERAEAWRQAGESMLADGLIDAEHFHGTVNCLALNAKGAVAGVTSTSGLAWKVPGRAAGSTGNGEAAMFSLGSFLIVEAMRNGSSPKDAGIAALKRVVANTVDKRAQLAVCTQDGSQMVPAEPLLTGKPSD